MSSSVEKSVKGATKLKLAPPKAKYIEHILKATRTGEQGIAEVFRVLQFRLRDSTWTIAFKALIVVHLMIREGEPGVTLSYLATAPRKFLGVNQYTDVQTQGRNIRNYSIYLIKRAEAFSKARCDYIVDGAGRLKKITIDKGLLRETEAVQDQMTALLRCDFMSDETENEISVTAFRLIVMDLKPLFTVMNEGTMNVLEHYFEMSRPDAERGLEIYKNFTKLTDQVIKFLNVARQSEHVTRVETPKLKHAPTSLTAALEDYLNDPDFEANRRQYLGGKDPKGTKSSSGPARAATLGPAKPAKSSSGPTRSTTLATPSNLPAQAKGPAPDLIDFFGSIEQNQQPMGTQPNNFQQQPTFDGAFPQNQPQAAFMPPQTGFVQQQPVGIPQQGQFGQQQAAFAPQQTGFAQGFQQQNGAFVSQQTGNPFGQVPQAQQMQQAQAQQPQQTGNPFGTFQQQTPQAQQPQQTGHPFGAIQQQPPQAPQQAQQLQPQFTGAGFGGYTPQPAEMPGNSGFDQFPQQWQQTQQQPTGGLQRQPTNPFRQSMLPSNTGQSASPFGQNQTGGNPFSRPSAIPEDSPMQSFDPQSFSSAQTISSATPQQQFHAQSLIPQRTGTNPFARNQQTASPTPLQAQATGTNPFRQSAFVNQSTGQGWQHDGQGTIGGYNAQAIETTPVFPRPVGQQLGYGQQQQQGFL